MTLCSTKQEKRKAFVIRGSFAETRLLGQSCGRRADVVACEEAEARAELPRGNVKDKLPCGRKTTTTKVIERVVFRTRSKAPTRQEEREGRSLANCAPETGVTLEVRRVALHTAESLMMKSCPVS